MFKLLCATSRRRTKAFTLIELIVVVVIMGILVGVGAFAYNAVMENSRKSAARATAEQFTRTVQGLSAAEQSPAASISVAARDQARTDVTDAGGTASWSPGVTFAEVRKGGYCTPVTFATAVGARPTLGATDKAAVCTPRATELLAGHPVMNTGLFYEIESDAPLADADSGFPYGAQNTRDYETSGNNATIKAATGATELFIPVWANSAAMPAQARVNFTYTPRSGGPNAAAAPATNAHNAKVRAVVRFDQSGYQYDMLVDATGTLATAATGTKDTPTAVEFHLDAQSAAASAVSNFRGSFPNLNVHGVVGIGVSVKPTIAAGYQSFDITNVTGSAR